VRKGDGHLLSVGDDTFINDNRFQARRIEASETWTLQIRSVQMDDAGEYECQVSSNEPKISRIVILHPVGIITSSFIKSIYSSHAMTCSQQHAALCTTRSYLMTTVTTFLLK